MTTAFFNCSYLPLEIPLAFGLTPVRIKGVTGRTPRADRFLPVTLCSYARSFLEEALKQKGSLFILVDCCDSVRRLADALEVEFPGKVFLSFLPRAPENWGFFAGELEKLWKFLAEYLGVHPENANLTEALERLQRRREVLRGWIKFQREGVVDPLDYFHAIQAFNDFRMAMDPPELKSKGKSRIFLLGNSIDEEEVWSILAEMGARVVGDDLCYGEKQAEIEIEAEGEPTLESLSRAYLSRPPCPRMWNLDDRYEDLISKVKERKVDCALLFPTKYCDSFLYDLPLLREGLRKSGIPSIVLEQDYSQKPAQQLRTRIEALLEKG
ncbi:MAG: 2-hydroxyacyl-CoA dehydratase family protein [Caldiserica bacterium]|jgi:benzoyl-CoA reductase/2-hydroxyglutaryl-CoA dehydratase subunit BcrC/BadD/HgdB|nr:2-hydroxyacyl-CoA dehydratase family protein [Caldisericota bacterium]MDH7562226.1 2-hydroxyacyl-CoA dehydratase family protein [Caldisericota bacterium]